MSNGARTSLKLAVAAAIVMGLLATGRLSFGAMVTVFRQPQTLATLVALQLAILAIGVLRWQLLLSAIAGRRQSFRDLLAYNWIGQFFGTFAPSTVATDVARFTYVVRSGTASSATVLASLVIDRVAGTTGTIVLAIILARRLVLASITPGSLMVLGAVVVVALVLVMATKRFQEVARIAAVARGASAFAIACAMAAMALKVVCIWLIVHSVSLSTSPAAVFSVAPVGFLVEAIPLAPGGMGTAHLSFEYLFATRGIAGGAAVFNAYFVIRLLVSLVGGLLWVAYTSGERRVGGDSASLLTDTPHSPLTTRRRQSHHPCKNHQWSFPSRVACAIRSSLATNIHTSVPSSRTHLKYSRANALSHSPPETRSGPATSTMSCQRPCSSR